MAKQFQIDTGATLNTSLSDYWNFEGNATDFFGADNGTDTGITYSTGNGKVAQGAGYDGTTSKIVLANSQPPSVFSLALWFKRASSGRDDPLFIWVASDNVRYYKIAFGQYGGADINRLQVGFRDTASNYIWKGTTTKITDTNWHLVIVQQNGAAIPAIYLDNVLETLVTLDSGGTPALPTVSLPHTIGYYTWTSATAYFSGALDEAGFWAKLLASQERTDIWNAGAGQTMINLLTQTLSETISNTPSLKKTPARTLTEAITHGDTFLKAPARTLSESITDTDTFLRLAARSLTETITSTDSILTLKIISQLCSDAFTLTDSFIRSIVKVCVDTITTTDTFVRSSVRTLIEAITTTDSITRLPGRILTETVTTLDTIIRISSRTFTETITTTASFVRSSFRSLVESITTTDSILSSKVAVRILSETISIVEKRIVPLLNGILAWYTSKYTARGTSHNSKYTSRGTTYTNKYE